MSSLPESMSSVPRSRRWQFSLASLFALISVVALVTAALTGAFGPDVQMVVFWLGALSLLLAVGLLYYLVCMLLLFSPMLLGAGILRFVCWIIRLRDEEGLKGEESSWSAFQDRQGEAAAAPKRS